MKFGIRFRLFSGFLFIILAMIVLTFYLIVVSHNTLYTAEGKSTVFLTKEILGRITYYIYLKIHDLKNFGVDPFIQKALKESNSFYEKLTGRNEYILEQDEIWKSVSKQTITPFMEQIINNSISDSLRQSFINYYEKAYGYVILGGLSVTNRYGVNIGQSQKTADFLQADEGWWQEARKNGFYISEVLPDEATDIFGITIAVRIDDEQGDFSGIVKGVLDISKIIREQEIVSRRYITTEIKLITQEGRLLYSTKTFRFFEDISKKAYFKKIGKESNYFSVVDGGRKKLFSYSRSQGFGSFPALDWILVISHDENEVLQPIYDLRTNIIITSLLLTLVSFLISFFIARSISKPVITLHKGIEIIGAGNLDFKVGINTGDEIGQLSRAFDNMVGNLKRITASRDELNREILQREKAEKKFKDSQAHLIQAEKMSALGTLTAGVAHEMNNPLMSMLNYIQYCEKHINSSSKEHNILKDAEYEVKKCIDIIKNLLTFSRMEAEGPEAYMNSRFMDIIERVVKLLSYKISVNNIKIIIDIPDKGIAMSMKANSIQQVLLNMVSNAIDAVRGKNNGQIMITVKREDHGIRLTVRDNGCGIPLDKLTYIFDPFFTTKNTGEGTGLGLSICRSIITAHKGVISCSSKVGQGTKFEIIFPVY